MESVAAIRSHIRINGSKSDSLHFDKNVYCLHFCPLFLWTGTTPDCVTMENARVKSLLFANDIARLASSSTTLRRATVESTMAAMQISTKKTEVVGEGEGRAEGNCHKKATLILTLIQPQDTLTHPQDTLTHPQGALTHPQSTLTLNPPSLSPTLKIEINGRRGK